MAIFSKEGVFSEPFGPGTYDLATRTSPIWSFFETIKYGLEQPYKGDIFLVSTRQFIDQKWGTPGPIPMSAAVNDAILLPVSALHSLFHPLWSLSTS